MSQFEVSTGCVSFEDVAHPNFDLRCSVLVATVDLSVNTVLGNQPAAQNCKREVSFFLLASALKTQFCAATPLFVAHSIQLLMVPLHIYHTHSKFADTKFRPLHRVDSVS
eukprot:TRINITY_DN5343_c0_g1_i2.p2 TRINITY_DN5343_c0_g1~~TRINITY_DN5343_c0_g1_i2.p2  ORF type:complete len:110 (+),score=0.50 TRINITY_DN5343_c0_g1_i2:332-661(+)